MAIKFYSPYLQKAGALPTHDALTYELYTLSKKHSAAANAAGTEATLHPSSAISPHSACECSPGRLS
jgi:hypothetical protein